jgi:O-acetyl-ADP-ribose deacetylase (regulator of RNase III)
MIIFGELMIHKVEGDILLSDAQVIAHGVAPNDDFKKGLALALREHWPALYKDFRHYCQTTHPKPGTIWTWGGTDGKRVVSLFTQEGELGHHGGKAGPATLSNVTHCLKALRKEIDSNGFSSVALPRLATGMSGLEWANVEPLIYEYLGSLAIPVYVYGVYKAGVKARETGA